MKRTEYHFGQTVFLNSLENTESIYGTCASLRSMIGTFVTIRDYCTSYDKGINIFRPLVNGTYPIHEDDISVGPPEKKERNSPIIKVELGEEAMFDEKELFT